MDKQRSKQSRLFSIIMWIIIVMAVGVLIFCSYQMILKVIDYKQSNNTFQQIQDDSVTDYGASGLNIKSVSDVDTSDALQVDWDAFEGTEIVAWFQMDDISYPIMQHKDNDYYLNHLPDGSVNRGGSLFLMNHNNPLLTDQSSFVYGHNMHDGSMFGLLKRYMTSDYKNHTFSVYLPDGTRHVYQFFSVKKVYEESSAYTWSFASDKTFMKWQQDMLNGSIVDTDCKPSDNAKYLTLSTCNGSHGTQYRLIICGQEVRVDSLQQPASWYQDYLQKYNSKNQKKLDRANEIHNQLSAIQANNLNSLWKERCGK